MKRVFVSIAQDGLKNGLRIMQWNLLARGLALPDGLPMVKPAHFDWTSCRLPLMVEEFSRYSPDIASVEELDQKDDLMSRLEPLGYKCVYSPNPDSPCLSLKRPSEFGPDGVAAIYKSEKVELLSHELIQLPMPTYGDGKVRKKLALAVILKLKSCDFKLRFIVVHLKAKKEFASLRAEQFQELTNYLTQIKGDDDIAATVISGDFNAEPVEPVIEMAKQSGFRSVMPTQGQDVYSTAKFQPDSRDKSKTLRHVRLIDYVFYQNTKESGEGDSSSSPKLRPSSYLKMPSLDDIGPTLLPNGGYPSDHLSLVVDFDIF